MNSLPQDSKAWSENLAESDQHHLSQKRWEGVLCLSISLIFIALVIINELLRASLYKTSIFTGLIIMLGLLLTIGTQCIKSADTPQSSLKLLIASAIANYTKTVVALFLIIFLILFFANVI
ncbi:MAG: hypothetical protein Q4F00_05600 [bacterium]|nr:hypothetical protein [bacterium]